MASAQAPGSESDDDFHSLSGRDSNDGDFDGDDARAMEPPEHPLSSMQGAFEESIAESVRNHDRPRSVPANAEIRRQRLLDAHQFDDSWTSRWKQPSNAHFHPLLKLMAQITFGMHLLQQNQAKSNQEVVKILQTHVDEVDDFLEKTAEDFDLALRDIDERIRFLQLPMQHLDVFDIMLDDKKFRTQLLEGNDKIEKIIDRTARAMHAALLDVQKGRQATKELGRFLNKVQDNWPTGRPDLEAIFTAMRGNEEGWRQCYRDLQTKGNDLGNKLIQLGTCIGEMSKMAGAASRRYAPPNGTTSVADPSVANPPGIRSKFNFDLQNASSPSSAVDKPLPREPDARGGASQAAVPNQPPASVDKRFETPRDPPLPRSPSSIAAPSLDDRPRTAGANSSARDTPSKLQGKTARVPGLLRAPGPLSSHPPELKSVMSDRHKSIPRPQSAGQATTNGLKPALKDPGKLAMGRSHTMSGTDHKTYSHVRAASVVNGPEQARGRDTISKEQKDLIAGSNFARRWSIRKRHLGATPDDASPDLSPHRPNGSASPGAGARSPRPDMLAPVLEQPDQASSTALKSALSPSAGTPPSRTPASSIRRGMHGARHSIHPDAASPAGNLVAPSVHSSMKGRRMSLRNIFQRKGKTASVAE